MVMRRSASIGRHHSELLAVAAETSDGMALEFATTGGAECRVAWCRVVVSRGAIFGDSKRKFFLCRRLRAYLTRQFRRQRDSWACSPSWIGRPTLGRAWGALSRRLICVASRVFGDTTRKDKLGKGLHGAPSRQNGAAELVSSFGCCRVMSGPSVRRGERPLAVRNRSSV
jgi:hypothetical protein